jgi:hypothetical protein
VFTIRGLTDTVGLTVTDNALAVDSASFNVNDKIHVTGLNAGSNYTLDGAANTWKDIDGNDADVEFNLWTQLEENKFAFNDAVTVAGLRADDVTDKIKVVDGVLNFVDSTVANDFTVHVQYADSSTKVSVAGVAMNLIEGDYDISNGYELAHTPQTLSSIIFDGEKIIFSDSTNTIDPADNNELFGFSTVDSGLQIGSTVDGVSISVVGGKFALFDGDTVAGMLNDGDAWQDGAISVDANEQDA